MRFSNLKKLIVLSSLLFVLSLSTSVSVFPAHAREETLEVAAWQRWPKLDEFLEVSREFAAFYGMTIDQHVLPPFDDYLNLLRSRFAAGDAPDLVVWAPVAAFEELIESDLLMPLDEFADQIIDIVPEEMLEPFIRGDRLYGIPVDAFGAVRGEAYTIPVESTHPELAFELIRFLLENEDFPPPEEIGFACRSSGDEDQPTLNCVARGEGGRLVQVEVPWQGRAVEVVQLPLDLESLEPRNGDEFYPEVVVINFEVKEAGTEEEFLVEFDPPILLRVEFTAVDYDRLDGQLTLAFFADWQWKVFTPEEHNFELWGGPEGGFGVAQVSGWNDPHIAW